jgi:hypothetical protein
MTGPSQLAKVLARFEELADDGSRIERYNKVDRPSSEGWEWAVQAGAALADIFLGTHPARVTWDATKLAFDFDTYNATMGQLLGIFRGATRLVRQGYVVEFADTIRAETLAELLDQADDLMDQGHLAAAAGIAGGALETHLRHLVDRHNLPVTGHGSISIYNDLIGRERKDNEIYSVGDGKLVAAWGDDRNLADHRPLEFTQKKTREGVELMIRGIRDFLVRVP